MKSGCFVKLCSLYPRRIRSITGLLFLSYLSDSNSSSKPMSESSMHLSQRPHPSRSSRLSSFRFLRPFVFPGFGSRVPARCAGRYTSAFAKTGQTFLNVVASSTASSAQRVCLVVSFSLSSVYPAKIIRMKQFL